MGSWVFRKRGPTTVQEICIVCDEKPQKKKPNGKFHPLCSKCLKKVYGKGRKTQQVKRYRKKKDKRKPFCENCGFVAVDMCQLDLDHIDGNHSNNSEDNLQTLCANCHRLKTLLNKDYLPTK